MILPDSRKERTIRRPPRATNAWDVPIAARQAACLRTGGTPSLAMAGKMPETKDAAWTIW